MRCFPSDSASPRCRNCHKQEICLTEVILYKVPMYFSSPPSFLDSSYHVTPESDIITVLRVLSTLQINVPYWLWQLHQHIYLQTQYTNTVLVMRAWEVWGFVTLVSTISIMMAMAVIVEIGESWGNNKHLHYLQKNIRGLPLECQMPRNGYVGVCWQLQ